MPATPTEKYYFAQRANSGWFYVYLHKNDADELMSPYPYNYDEAQSVVDNFNKSAGLVAPVDDDFSEEDEED